MKQTTSGDTSPSNNIHQEQLEVIATLPRVGSYSIIVGVLLILVGCTGIILPEFMALEATIFIACLLLVGSIFWVIHAFKNKLHGWADWFKPLLLFISSGLMLFYPMTGVAAIGVLLVAYLILDSFGSFTFAYMLRPLKGWGWMVFNGVTSLGLAILFLIGWPESTLLIVGLFISISLFFDGWTLLYMGWVQRKLSAESSNK
jgi:uncharacterized membrane protein HdeD (DUF308 family)